MHVGNQLGFPSSETILSNQNYKKMCLDHGIMVDTYFADNCVFKSNIIVQHIGENNQHIRYYDVNTHNQNG